MYIMHANNCAIFCILVYIFLLVLPPLSHANNGQSSASPKLNRQRRRLPQKEPNEEESTASITSQSPEDFSIVPMVRYPASFGPSMNYNGDHQLNSLDDILARARYLIYLEVTRGKRNPLENDSSVEEKPIATSMFGYPQLRLKRSSRGTHLRIANSQRPRIYKAHSGKRYSDTGFLPYNGKRSEHRTDSGRPKGIYLPYNGKRISSAFERYSGKRSWNPIEASEVMTDPTGIRKRFEILSDFFSGNTDKQKAEVERKSANTDYMGWAGRRKRAENMFSSEISPAVQNFAQVDDSQGNLF